MAKMLGWCAIVVLCTLALANCHDHHHGHSHGEGGHEHDHEPPHYKYSRQANEQAAAAAASHHHSHQHDDDDHGHHHSHGEDLHHGHHHSHEHGDDHGHAHAHHGHSHEHVQSKPKTPTKRSAETIDTPLYDPKGPLRFLNDARARLWAYALGATLAISVAPFVILFFIPIQANTAENGPMLKILLALGSGGLLGDAFLHLIPHAMPAGGHSHSHSHSHSEGHSHEPHDMSVGMWVLAGIISFLTVEKLVRIVRGGGHGHSHGHAHADDKKSDDAAQKKKAKSSDDESTADSKKSADKSKAKPQKEVAKHHEEEHDGPNIKVAAFLNLVADFAHNFTDGLAIGASFLAGTPVGVVTMVTVLVHEVPHEIGDFAILVQSGYSKRRAMAMQLVTALGALSGCVLSLWSADPNALADAAATSWVLPFTAGGFIYIATVSVIPELLEGSTSFGQTIAEMAAMLVGIALMYLIALFE